MQAKTCPIGISAILAFFLLYLSISIHSQTSAILLSGTTGAVLGQLEESVNRMLERARETGDYVLANAAVKMRDAMDAWKSANTELLNVAFTELSNASRELFANICVAIANTDDALKNRLRTIEETVQNANQIVESISLRGRTTYLLKYEPRVAPPNLGDKLRIRVRGVNLDRGNPNIQLSTGTAARDLVGPQEVTFTIPTSEVPADEGSMEVRTLKLTYTSKPKSLPQWISGRREELTRQLSIIVLPKPMAEYSLKSLREVERREEDSAPVDLGQFKGKNERVQRIVQPPGFEQGWRWDLRDKSKYSVVQTGGEAGRFEHVDWNASSPNGIVVVARCDEIKTLTRIGPGYVDLAFRGLRYRTIKEAVDGTPRSGTLTWNKDELVPLDSGVKSITLTVKTFDRREVIFSGTGSDKFFIVNRDGDRLLIRPKIPEDIVN